MKRSVSLEDTSDQVDLSPLIDMVFILLIFFMVTTTFIKDKELHLNRPAASSSSSASDKSLRVSVDKDRKIYFNSEEVALWALQGLVSESLSKKDNKDVLVKVDQSLDTKTLIDIVDELKLGGAESVGVATSDEG